MAEREVVWKALADFSSIVREANTAKKALYELDAAQKGNFTESSAAATRKKTRSLDELAAASKRAKAAEQEVQAAQKETQKVEAAAAKATKSRADLIKEAAAGSRARVDALKAESSALAQNTSQQQQSISSTSAFVERLQAAAKAEAARAKALKASGLSLDELRVKQKNYNDSLSDAESKLEAAGKKLDRYRDSANGLKGAFAVGRVAFADQVKYADASEKALARLNSATLSARKAQEDLGISTRISNQLLLEGQRVEENLSKIRKTEEQTTAAFARAQKELGIATKAQQVAEENLTKALKGKTAGYKVVQDAEAALADAEVALEAATRKHTFTEQQHTNVIRSRRAIEMDHANVLRAATDITIKAEAASRKLAAARQAEAVATSAVTSNMERYFRTISERTEALGSKLSNMTGGLRYSAIALGVFGGLIPLVISAMTQLMTMITSVTAGFAGMVGTLVSATGILGALPGLLIGVGGAIGVIVAGMQRSLSAVKLYTAAQKSAAGASTSAANTMRSNARSLRDAEESLASAQRAALKSQNALNQARVDAAQKIVDLRKEIKQLALDEMASSQSVEQARLQLQQTLNDPGSTDLERRQAALAVEEAKARLADVQDQQKSSTDSLAKLQQQGIEGSDGVVQALENQQEALRAITKAQENLADAQMKANEGTGAAATTMNQYAAAMAKMTPEAQAVVKQMIAMGGAIRGIQATAERGLMPGVLVFLKNIQTTIPYVDAFVASVSKIGGDMFAKIGESLGSKSGLNNIKKIFDNTIPVVQDFSTIFLNLLKVFGNIALAGAPLTRWLADTVTQWTAFWAAATSGTSGQNRLTRYFADAQQSISLVGTAIWNLLKNFGTIAAALKPIGDIIFKAIGDTAARWNEFNKSLEGQTALKKWGDNSISILTQLWGILGDIGNGIMDIFALDDITPFLKVVREQLGPALGNMFKAFTGPQGQTIASSIAHIVEGLAKLFSNSDYVKGVATIFGFVGDALNKIGEEGNKMAPALLWVLTALTGLKAAFVVLGPAIKITGGILGFFTKNLGDGATAFTSMVARIKASQLASVLGDGVSAFKGFASKAGEYISAVSTAFSTWIKGLGSVSVRPRLFDQLSNGLADVKARALDTATSVDKVGKSAANVGKNSTVGGLDKAIGGLSIAAGVAILAFEGLTYVQAEWEKAAAKQITTASDLATAIDRMAGSSALMKDNLNSAFEIKAPPILGFSEQLTTGVSDAFDQLEWNNKNWWEKFLARSQFGLTEEQKQWQMHADQSGSVIKKQLDEYDKALATLADSGSADKAMESFNTIVAQSGRTAEEVAPYFTEYRKQLEEVAASMGLQTKVSGQEYIDWMGGKVPAAVRSAASAQGNASVATRDLGTKYADLTDLSKKLAGAQIEVANATQKASDAALAASDADIAYQQSLADAQALTAKGLEAKKKGLETTSQAGRDNLSVLNQLAAAGKRSVKADADAGAGSEALSKKMATIREAWIQQRIAYDNTSKSATEARAKAEAAADAAGLVPGTIPVTITVAKEEADKKVADFAMRLSKLPPAVQTFINSKLQTEGFEAAQAALDALTKPRVVTIKISPVTGDIVTSVGYRATAQANGSILNYEDGGVEQHVAQVAPAGAWRVWAEPETGGEAYIPLSPSKRERSVSIWRQTGKILGQFANGGITKFANGGVTSSATGAVGASASGGSFADVEGKFASLSSTITSTWSSMWDGVSTRMSKAFGKITSDSGSFLNTITSAFSGMFAGLSAMFAGFQSTVSAVFNNVYDAVRSPISSIIMKVINPFVNAFNSLAGAIPGVPKLSNVADLPARAQGGILHGPGTGTSDSILGIDTRGVPTARVSNGEFVVNAASTRKHRALIEAINSDQLPRHATGGLVSYKGGTFTMEFAKRLAYAEQLSKENFNISQGGFRPATSYSGTSHRGDAVDITSPVNNITVIALRQAGLAAWDRTGKGNWAPHIHGVPLPGAGDAEGSAIWQAQDYLRGGDGLGGRDNGPRVSLDPNMALGAAISGGGFLGLDLVSLFKPFSALKDVGTDFMSSPFGMLASGMINSLKDGVANSLNSWFGLELPTSNSDGPAYGSEGTPVAVSGSGKGGFSAPSAFAMGGLISAAKSSRGYARGTNWASPGWRWTGENGPELVHFSGGESVVSNQALANGGLVSGNSVSSDPLEIFLEALQNMQNGPGTASKSIQALQKMLAAYSGTLYSGAQDGVYSGVLGAAVEVLQRQMGGTTTGNLTSTEIQRLASVTGNTVSVIPGPVSPRDSIDNGSQANNLVAGDFTGFFRTADGSIYGMKANGESQYLSYAQWVALGSPMDKIFSDAGNNKNPDIANALSEQMRSNVLTTEFNSYQDTFTGWGLDYLVENFSKKGASESLEMMRQFVKNRSSATTYDNMLKNSGLTLSGTKGDMASKRRLFHDAVVNGTDVGLQGASKAAGVSLDTGVSLFDAITADGGWGATSSAKLHRLVGDVADFRNLFKFARFAEGGFIPGVGDGDTTALLGTPGEFMIRKAAAQQLGPEALNYLNNIDRMPKFNAGGFIGAFTPPSVSGYVGAGSMLGRAAVDTNVGGKAGSGPSFHFEINNPVAEPSSISTQKAILKLGRRGLLDM